MAIDRKKGRFDPNAHPPSRGHGSSHAKRPITALGGNPRNALERLASDVSRSTRNFEDKVQEATTRANAGSVELTELGLHLNHIELLLNAVLDAVEGYATEVVRNTRAIDQNTLEVRENSKLLRQALGLDRTEKKDDEEVTVEPTPLQRVRP